MSPQDAHDNVPAEPREVAGADERVAAALGPFTIPIAIILLLAIVVAYYYGRRIGEAEAG